MWCISFPYHYLSSPPRTISKKTESHGSYKCNRKTNPKAMKRLKTLEWTLAVYCCVLIVESFCGISSITTSAKHIKTTNVDDNIRLLSYLDNDNHLPTASLENLSAAKLIGHDSSENISNDHTSPNGNKFRSSIGKLPQTDDSRENISKDNSFDDISKLLQMDDANTLGRKSTAETGRLRDNIIMFFPCLLLNGHFYGVHFSITFL